MADETDPIKATFADLQSVMRAGGDAAAIFAKQLNLSRQALKQIGDEQEREGRVLRELTAKYKDATNSETKQLMAIRLMAGEIAKGSKIMADATKDELSSRAATYRQAIEQLNSIDKKASLEKALLAKGAHEIETGIFRNKLREQIELGRFTAQSETGFKRLSGVGQVLSGNLKMAGQATAEFSGGLFGLSASTMASIAGLAGAGLAIYMAFKAIIENAYKGAQQAGKSFIDLGDSALSAGQAGSQYSQILAQEAWSHKAAGFMAIYTADKIQELVEVGNREYLPSLVAIGGAYVDLVNGIGKSRMDLAKETVSFAADMAFVGQRFGMTDEESVKLATRMGVLSRSGFEPTRVAFVKLSSDSIHLGIGMDSLVGTFGILAEASTYAGHQAEYNVAQLEQLADTLMSLSKNGVPGFQNMTSQAVDAMIRKSAEFLSKVDDMKIAAITTRPGEGFGQMLERVAHMGASDRAGSVKQLATKTGMSLDINDTKSAFAIAKMMGFSGNLQDTLRMGRFLQEGATKGHLSEDMIKKRMASDIDDRLSKSKSVGEAVAAGADINQLIASTLQSILRILVSWSSSLMFRGTLSTETRNMAERASGMGGKGASPALGYGYRIPQLGRKN